MEDIKNIKDLKVLINSNDLKNRIKEVADEINNFYGTKEPLTIICILRGAVMFFTELSKYLKMPVKMEFVTLSSYGNSKKSTGHVKAVNLAIPDLENQNALIVEDIVDTGLTLDFLMNFIRTHCKVKSVKLAVLFDKKCARKFNITPDFSAFDIDDKFIVGFGLDYNGYYRNLDYIGYFE